MEIKIDIEDFISKEKIQKIAEEELRYAFREQINNAYDIKATLANLTHEYVFKIVAEEFDGDFEQEIKNQMLGCILNDSTIRYEMFRQKSAWEHDDGPAYTILNEECEKLRPLMYEVAKKHIEEYPFDELDRDDIQDAIGRAIMDALSEAMARKDEW